MCFGDDFVERIDVKEDVDLIDVVLLKMRILFFSTYNLIHTTTLDTGTVC